MIKFGILCVSDRCSAKICEDKSGPLISDIVSNLGKTVTYETVPDEISEIKKALIKMSDHICADIIFTTGGTGFAPRDVTPEATREVIQKEVPGIPEAIRAKSLETTPKAMLSRSIAGIRNQTLIINLPGSPKAVKESLEVITPVLEHAVEILQENTVSCGGNYK